MADEMFGLECESVTPMFVGGAGEDSCELRAPSIRGELRFWFRFAAGARLFDNGPDYWKQVAEEEGQLFGNTKRDGGRGAVSVRVTKTPHTTTGKRGWSQNVGYLGYGPVMYDPATRACEPKRPFVDANKPFSIQIRYRGDATGEVRLIEAIRLWIAFGGIGSRSRRGWGSFRIVKADPRLSQGLGSSRSEVTAALRGLISDASSVPARDVAFTHACDDVRVCCPFISGNWKAAMEKIGAALVAYRSIRKSKRFLNDYNNVKNFILNGTPPSVSIDRASFGLPHNYFYGSLKPNATKGYTGSNPFKADVMARRPGPGGTAIDVDRRASPLFVRLHKLNNGNVAVVLMIVPTPLLPQDWSLQAIAKADYKITPVGTIHPSVPSPTPGMSAVTAFFDEMQALEALP